MGTGGERARLVNRETEPGYAGLGTFCKSVLARAIRRGLRTGTPEPGGLSARELLYAVRQICSRLPVRSLGVVEVSPPYDPSGVTALAAHRCVLEGLSGIALRRVGREARPQRPARPIGDAAGR